MGPRMWRTLILGLGAVVVAVTTGTAVMAAIDDQDDPPAVRQTFESESICIEGTPDCVDTFDAAGGACLAGSSECNDTPGAVARMCAPGYPDCQDTVVGDDGFAQCATDEPCGDFDAKCAADTACIEPWLMEEPVCPEGMAYEECFPEGTPPGWDCVQLESFPVQVKCSPIYCAPTDGPISILPLPAEDLPLEVEPQIEPVDPSLIDPGVSEPPVAEGEPVPLPMPIDCLPPPVDCDADPIPDPCLGSECAISSRQSERCLPPECTVTDDGAIACKIPPDVECGPTELCVAPDCAVSSDGSVFCPDPAPVPCGEVEGVDGGCSSPGSCGDLGCSGEGYACPDGITDEECAKLNEEERRNSGGGSSGSGGSTEAIE